MPVLTNIRVEQALAKGDPAETLPAWTPAVMPGRVS